jgi:predicted metal-dependent hydrolase
MKRGALKDYTPATRLRHRVDGWCVRLKVLPRQVRFQQMRRKWGSCSTLGTVTLALDLDEQEPGFQDYVIIHELLHLKVKNHGRLFKALMSAYVPDWRKREADGQSRSYAGAGVRRR